MFGKKTAESARPKTKVDLGRIGLQRDMSQNGTGSEVCERDNRDETWAVCSIKLESGEVREGVVMDLSRSGARIRLHQRGSVSKRVVFRCPRYQVNRIAELVWYDGFDIGVHF